VISRFIRVIARLYSATKAERILRGVPERLRRNYGRVSLEKSVAGSGTWNHAGHDLITFVVQGTAAAISRSLSHMSMMLELLFSRAVIDQTIDCV
jgi:hypothetical protein